MSFGTARESEILKKAIQDAADCGIMIVGSAGNGGSGADVEYPAAFDEVIAVGAVDTSAQKTEESTTGSEVELVAPGSQIMTKSMLGMTTVSSGTSMAAPHVTGAAALLMQQDGEKEAEEIRYILDVSSNPLGETDEYGYGIIDVKHAQELFEDNVEIEDYVFHDKELSFEESVDKRERRTVETFENIDYVEGRWDSNPNHQKLMQAAVDECGGFSATEILLLKAGMIYPDNKKGGLRSDAGHPEWHGKKGENYIANFIFATKIAKAGGVTSNLTKAKGQSKDCYNRMKKAISKSGINGIGWKTIIEQQAELDYASQSDETKEEWRKYFLYGMAAHTATDTFAHSCYYKDGKTGKMVAITHSNGADDPSVCPSRYKCAGLIAYYVAQECQENWLGDVQDFSAYGFNYWNGFYMGNVLDYAIKADDCYGSAWLTKIFKSVNYKL